MPIATDAELASLRRVLTNAPPCYTDSRCGHNYEVCRCPYPRCASRELYETLTALLRWSQDTPHPLPANLVIPAELALAKARGEK